MEHFESNNGKVREKSMYLLHLDTPRIVILASVITGLVVISFLLGMNFIRDGEAPGERLAQSDMLFNDQRGSAISDQGIPNPPHSELNPGPIDSAIAELEKSDDKLKKDNAPALPMDGGKNGDVLTADNMSEIIPPVKDDSIDRDSRHALKEPEIVKPKKSEKRRSVAKNKTKADRKKDTASRKKKSSVQPVVSDENDTVREAHGYVIQVASYDRKSRAQDEVSNLKKLKYDAFMDGTKVNGKQYYRVRIGPLSSRETAQKLLGEVQGNDRYAESYMTKE